MSSADNQNHRIIASELVLNSALLRPVTVSDVRIAKCARLRNSHECLYDVDRASVDTHILGEPFERLEGGV